MTKRPLSALVAIGMGIGTAGATLPVLAAPASSTGQGTATAGGWVDPPRATSPVKSSTSAAAQPAMDSPPSKSPDTVAAETTSSVSKVAEPTSAAPKVTEAKSRALFGVAGKSDTAAPTKFVSAGTPVSRPAIAPQASAPKKPALVRTARYAGNEGGAWKVGRNAYAFSGSFGGCRITGRAGPGGFTIDRAC